MKREIYGMSTKWKKKRGEAEEGERRGEEMMNERYGRERRNRCGGEKV